MVDGDGNRYGAILQRTVERDGVFNELPHMEEDGLIHLLIAFYKKFDTDCDTELTQADFVKGFQAYAERIGQKEQ